MLWRRPEEPRARYGLRESEEQCLKKEEDPTKEGDGTTGGDETTEEGEVIEEDGTTGEGEATEEDETTGEGVARRRTEDDATEGLIATAATPAGMPPVSRARPFSSRTRSLVRASSMRRS